MAPQYSLELSPQAHRDLKFWGKSDRAKIFRIEALLLAILADPYSGIGKPRELRHDLAGAWSRRIDSKNRVIYEVEGRIVRIISLRGHYGDA
jgi:toxin YoeB